MLKDIRAQFDYNPKTGVFTRKVRAGKNKVGSTVGSDNGIGYMETKIKGKKWYLHRLAWFIYHGEMPRGEIDHINGIRSDNRIVNLRDVTASNNCRNSSKPSSNSSGHIGVTWHKGAAKWMAHIKMNGKQKYLGVYKEKEVAIQVRKEAEAYYGFHKNHGK